MRLLEFKEGFVFDENNDPSALVTKARPEASDITRSQKGVSDRDIFALRRGVRFGKNSNVSIVGKHNELLKFFLSFAFEPVDIPGNNIQGREGRGALVIDNRGREGYSRCGASEDVFRSRVRTTEVLVDVTRAVPNERMHSIRIPSIAFVPERCLCPTPTRARGNGRGGRVGGLRVRGAGRRVRTRRVRRRDAHG